MNVYYTPDNEIIKCDLNFVQQHGKDLGDPVEEIDRHLFYIIEDKFGYEFAKDLTNSIQELIDKLNYFMTDEFMIDEDI